MVIIELVHTFPVSVSEAFAYITDERHWHEYWPDFVRIGASASNGWSRAGDKGIIVQRILWRDVELNIEMEAFETDKLMRYRSRQADLPDAFHERYFTATPQGVEFRQVVKYEPRAGLAWLLDVTVLRWAITRALQNAVHNLDKIFQKQRSTKQG